MVSLSCPSVLRLWSLSLQGHAAAVREKAQLEAARGAAEDKAGGLSLDAERSHARSLELETQVGRLTRVVEEARQQETRLGDRVVRLEVSRFWVSRGGRGVGRSRGSDTLCVGRFQRDKKHLEEAVAEVKEQEEEMSRANRALSTRFDDVQVGSAGGLGPCGTLNGGLASVWSILVLGVSAQESKPLQRETLYDQDFSREDKS